MSATINIIETTTELGIEVVEVVVASASTPGPAGADGEGVPAGGTTGQRLAKASDTDFDTEWTDAGTPGLHASTHEDGGADEISLTGLSGTPAALTTHEADTTSVHGIADTSALALTANHPSNATFEDHSARHEDGGADEINLAGLSGTPADLTTHLNDTADAHDASAISFTPAGTIAATDVQAAIEEVASEAGGGGAPTDVDYLVGTASGGLSAEIVVGTSPGGELGGTWASPTVDASHSGSTHAAVQAAAEATAAAALSAHLTDTADAHDASAISVDSTSLSGTGTDVQASLEELDNLLDDHSARHENGGADEISLAGLDGTSTALQAHLDDTADAHDATAISFSPAGTIAATTVQAAIEEVASEAGGAGVPSLQYETRSSNTILGVADKGKTIDITATITQTFEADETLGDGWWVILRNATDDGTTVVTLNPAGSETIDALTTVTMYSGEARLIFCNGTGANFNSVLLEGGFARFTADGNFIVPHGITQAVVDCFGGGGGGGGGRGGAAGSLRKGGAGGGGGARSQRSFAALALGNPGDSIAVTVGPGGTSGPGGSSGDGTAGGVGGTTVFGTLSSAFGGGGGGPGNATGQVVSGGSGGGVGEVGTSGANNVATRGGSNPTTGAAGQGGSGGGSSLSVVTNLALAAEWGGGGGGAVGGTAGPNAGGSSVHGGAGGGSGGGLTSSNTEQAGAAGGTNHIFSVGGGGTAGAVNGGGGGNGDPGTSTGGEGGGGGGAQDSGTGGVGGTGGAPGGGGGGGAGGTTVGGAGGVGGIGECRVWYS